MDKGRWRDMVGGVPFRDTPCGDMPFPGAEAVGFPDASDVSHGDRERGMSSDERL
jgi:hypothetical protein